MILVDTSIWIDHIRLPELRLENLIANHYVVMHPFVIGEVAMGSMKKRDLELGALRDLPRIAPAYDEEVIAFVSLHQIFGTGIGYIDAHLLTPVKLLTGTSLWTRDKRLLAAAERLDLAWTEAQPF